MMLTLREQPVSGGAVTMLTLKDCLCQVTHKVPCAVAESRKALIDFLSVIQTFLHDSKQRRLLSD